MIKIFAGSDDKQTILDWAETNNVTVTVDDIADANGLGIEEFPAIVSVENDTVTTVHAVGMFAILAIEVDDVKALLG